MADITTHLERLAKTAMDLEIPVLLEAKEEILRLRQSWHLHRDEIERLREACKNASSYISVRDQFAMAALTGMLMRSVGYEETSEKAYKFADAMIKTRTALGEEE